MKKDKISNITNNRTKVFIGIGVLIAVAIILLKTLSNKPAPGPVASDSTNVITASPELPTDESSEAANPTDSLPAVIASDTIGVDSRPPYEAGNEDGYNNGLDDGHAKKYKLSYDESNAFKKRNDARKYIEGYREGYEKGYKDGVQGNEFNLSPPPTKETESSENEEKAM